MQGKTKRSFKAYTAWNYEQEIEDLNRASEQGWQLVKGGCFSSTFEQDPNVRYRYQLDFRKIDNMGRYLETFREQGWEYVNSTFNGWHYFRKRYDPSLPEEAYEIFTDRESVREMNRRWARIALVIGIVVGLLAVISLVRMIRRPNIPTLILMLTFAIESAFLLRGVAIMRRTDAGKRRNDGRLLLAFIVVILIGAGSNAVLQSLRPVFTTEQQASSTDRPVLDGKWLDFTVRYADNYYLDLTLEGDKPVTVKVLDETGQEVCSRTGTAVSEEGIRLWLSKGTYRLALSAQSGFHVTGAMH